MVVTLMDCNMKDWIKDRWLGFRLRLCILWDVLTNRNIILVTDKGSSIEVTCNTYGDDSNDIRCLEVAIDSVRDQPGEY